MERLHALWKRYREPIMYLIFGVLTTAVNTGLYAALKAWSTLPTAVSNAIALAASILFAYVTNRKWVFESKKTGKDAMEEFLSFIGCRVLTGFLDEGIVVLGEEVIGAPAAINPLLWSTAVKLFASAIVIIVNYIFSKLLIFRSARPTANR